MNLEIYKHNCSESIDTFPAVESTISCIKQLEFQFSLNTASDLRESVLSLLMTKGWSNSVKIAGNTNISITSIRDRTGLCLQTGNMARFYADFLKLEVLYKKNHIDNSIYCVLSKQVALKMGSNLANFDRVTHELQLFSEIITVPMIVLGMYD
jgi:hypothetical protein